MVKDITLKNSLGRFRMVALLEGISFIVLLGIAMPMKYYMGFPMVVKVVGWAHGLLFILYLYALLQVAIDRKWSIVKIGFAFIASLVPIGTFILDVRLRREEQEIIKAGS